MIDLKKFSENPNEYKTVLLNRGWDPSIADKMLTFDKQRRELISKVEKLRNEKKVKSKEFGTAKRTGQETTKI